MASRKRRNTIGEESITLTLPVSVAHAALDALKQLTIDQHWKAGQQPSRAEHWRKLANETERHAEFLHRAIARL